MTALKREVDKWGAIAFSAIVVLFFFLLSHNTRAQSPAKLDSLEQKVTTVTGAERASVLYDLVYGHLRSDIRRAESHITMVKSLLDSETDIEALAYLTITQGIYYAKKGLLDSSILILDKAKAFAQQSRSQRALVRVFHSLGNAYISSGKPKPGIENLFAGLRVLDQHPDPEIELKLRTSIAWAYLELKRYRDCVRYGLSTIRLANSTSYEWIALYSYNNVAIGYGALGQLDSAKYFIEKGISAAQRNGDNQALANGYFILGNIYAEAHQYDQAIEQYLKARPFREKVGNPLFIVADLYTIAELYYKTGNYRKGIEAGRQALQVAEQYSLLLKFEDTYHSLAQNYQGLGDYNNASKYYRLWAIAKDSVYKNANAQAIAEMAARYEAEKKEQQLAVQKAQLAEQMALLQLTYVIIGALILAVFLIIVIFLLTRTKLKRERELFLREAQIQATIQSQENERRRFARDLHDGMGQLISALRLALHTIHRDTPLEGRVAVVNKAEALLNDIHQEIRSIAFNLMPQTLVQHGLIPALKEMGSRVQDASKISVRVMSLDIPDRLTELLEVTLYRIIQEWITNVTKYASASIIEVQLIGYPDEINVVIEDDGNGFDVAVLENSKGNGWRNIRSRVNLVKGTLDVDSRRDRHSTTLIIKVPFNNSGVTGAITVDANTH